MDYGPPSPTLCDDGYLPFLPLHVLIKSSPGIVFPLFYRIYCSKGFFNAHKDFLLDIF